VKYKVSEEVGEVGYEGFIDMVGVWVVDKRDQSGGGERGDISGGDT